MQNLFTPDVIVMMAGGTMVLGYLIINQVGLRVMVMAGSGLYIWYYFVATQTPLWEAIYLSAAMIVANLLGLAGLYLRQSRLAVPAAHKDIYPRFSALPPGDFRDLMRHATRRVLDQPEQITAQNAPLSRLTYVISGGMRVEKSGDSFNMPAGLFVGEVAYLMQQNSAASTWVDAGSEVLQWEVADLRARSARKDRFKLALEAMISKDLAMKVQVAVAPNTAQWRQQAGTQQTSA